MTNQMADGREAMGFERRRIYLMRHAEAAYVTEDGRRAPDARVIPLTARGRGQAEAMRQALDGHRFDRAVCSGLPRTVETARIVLGERDLPLVEIPALEEIRPGSLDGVSPAHFEMEVLHGMNRAADDEARFLNGERFADFEARVVPALEEVVAAPGWRTLLLVAHGGTNRMVLGWACKSGRTAFPAFEQDSACLNLIDVDIVEGAVARVLIRAVNFTPYNWTKEGMTRTTMEALLRDLKAAQPA